MSLEYGISMGCDVEVIATARKSRSAENGCADDAPDKDRANDANGDPLVGGGSRPFTLNVRIE